MKAFALITSIRPYNKAGITLDFYWACNGLLGGTARLDVDLTDLSTKVADDSGFKAQLVPQIKAIIEAAAKQSVDDVIIL